LEGFARVRGDGRAGGVEGFVVERHVWMYVGAGDAISGLFEG
jgi:hypothetical protein